MSIVEFLSQPLWQRLGLTLVHFLWQGLAVAVLAGAFVRVSRLKHGNARYGAYLLAFIAMIACPVVTFTAIDISISPDTELVTGAESAEVIDISPSPYTALPVGDVLPEAETSSPTIPISADSIPLGQRISGWLNVSMPWILVIWMAGVVVLSLRLLMGFVGVYRWRHHLGALPERLAQRIVSLSEGLGMRGFSRVFISPTVLQAMAVGYLRPMVLLPAAMVTQMQPEMLEAVIAHELAHIRRFDLWVNLIQRITETLLFYHPAVWWLSNCIRRERELCCDELAVKATGQRLTYATTLESVGRARLMAKQPVLATGLGQDKKPTLGRVRHILGLKPTQRNCPFWLAGVITVLFLAALVIPTTLALTNQSDEKLNDHSDAQRIKALLIKPEIVTASDDRAKLFYFSRYVHCLDLAKLVAEKIAFITDKNITCDEDKNQISVVCPTIGDAETVLKFLQEVDLKPIRVQVDVHVVEAYSDVELDLETRESVRNITRTKTASNAKPEKSLSAPDILRETAKAEPQPENSIEKLIDLLASRGYLKILMNPRLEVKNGKTAKIESSQRLPSGKEINDLFEVTPRILADGSINVATKMVFQNMQIADPRTINIKDSGSLVIGSVTKTEKRDIVRDGVKVSEERTTEVLVILTLTVINPEMNLSKEAGVEDKSEHIDVETLLNKVRQAQRPTANMIVEWQSEKPQPLIVTARRAREPDFSPPARILQTYKAIIAGDKSRIEERELTFQSQKDTEPSRIREITYVFDGTVQKQLDHFVKGFENEYGGYRHTYDKNTQLLLELLLAYPPFLDNPKLPETYNIKVTENKEKGLIILETSKENSGIHRFTIDPDKDYNIVKQEVILPRGKDYEINCIVKKQANGLWYQVAREQIRYSVKTGKPSLENKVTITKLDFNPEIPTSAFELQFPKGIKIWDGSLKDWVIVGDEEETSIEPAGTVEGVKRPLHFPDMFSVGTLYIRDPITDNWYKNWERHGEANGEISVPAGKQVKLAINESAVGDLSFLSELGAEDIQMLSFGWKAVTLGSLAPIGNLRGLKALNLQSARFEHEDLKYLTKLSELEVLRLGDYKLTDESMRYIGELTSLRSLALWGTGISKEGLFHLQNLKNLTFLALNNCEINDSGLSYLKNMTNLEGLQLTKTGITSNGISSLSHLFKLKSLVIGHNNITDEGIEKLQTLTLLENLWINNTLITDDGLAYLSDMKNLKELYTSNTKISDAGLVHLKGLKDFWHLSITGIGDEGISHLSELPSLKHLQIHDAQITKASIPYFQKMESIEKVLLSGEKINDDLLEALRATLPACKIWDPQRSRDYPTEYAAVKAAKVGDTIVIGTDRHRDEDTLIERKLEIEVEKPAVEVEGEGGHYFEQRFELGQDIPVQLKVGKVDNWIIVSAKTIRFEKDGDNVGVELTADVRNGLGMEWQTKVELLSVNNQVLDVRTVTKGTHGLSDPPVMSLRKLEFLPFEWDTIADAVSFRVSFEQLSPIRDAMGREPASAPKELIQGRITDPKGRPVADAVVTIAEYNPGANSYRVPKISTNQRGYYKLGKVNWSYYIVVQRLLPTTFGQPELHQSIRLKKVFEGAQTIDLQFDEFPKGSASLECHIVNKDGEAVEKFHFMVLDDTDWEAINYNDPAGGYIRTKVYRMDVDNTEGRFTVEDLPAGSYKIWIIPKDGRYKDKRYEDTTEKILIEEGAHVKKIIEVPSNLVLYGRVLFEDGSPAVVEPTPWPGAKSSIIVPMGRRARGIADIDDDGYFAVHLSAREHENLKSGNDQLMVNIPTSQEGRRRTVGKFPFEILSEDRDKAGVIRVKRPEK